MNFWKRNKTLNLKKKREISPEDIFLDKLAQEREKEMGIASKRIETPLTRNSLFYLFLLFCLLMLALGVQVFSLQIIHHQEYLELAKANYQRVRLIRPLRGIIYDRSLTPLVENLPSFDLLLDKRNLPLEDQKRKEVIERVAELLQRDVSQFKKEIEQAQLPQVLVAENLSHQTLISLKAELSELPGFFIEENTIRHYLAGPSFSHILGYLAKINPQEVKTLSDYSIADYIGREGLEKYYEKILRGQPGKIEIKKDALGRTLEEKKVQEVRDGQSLLLWLDKDLEKVLADSLKKSIQRVGAETGAAVALDPKTGGVLALVSWPNFDNNLFAQGITPKALKELQEDSRKPLFDRVIAGQYPTGSTIKPLIAAAALEENIINPEKKILAKGYIEVPNKYNPNIVYRFRDWKVHGWTDMRKAIANSVNVYFYTIGGGYKEQKGLGIERIKEYLALFGWGEKTGIDLPGEKRGFLPDPEWKKETLGEGWYIGNTYHLSIGQGYLRVTPLQVAVATAALANGGKLLKPQLVKAILDRQKNIIQEKSPQILREDFIKPQNLKVVREGMRDAVIYGSSKILNQLPVKVAAKTGTAQTSKENRYHHWVTLFAPYDDPQIVLTILIENVKGLRSATLPVALEVLNWYFANIETRR